MRTWTSGLILFAAALSGSVPTVAQGENKRAEKTTPTERNLAPAIHFPAEFVDLKNLPSGYRGQDLDAILHKFRSVSSLEKGEFEKEDSFNERKLEKWKKSGLSPESGRLGFVVDLHVTGINFSYDADSQSYQVRQSSGRFCDGEQGFKKRIKSLQVCVIGRLNYKRSTYSGTNAFGTSVTVTKERGLYFSLGTPFTGNFIREYQQPKNSYHHFDTIKYPIELARKQKTADLGIVFIGKIENPELIEGRAEILEPTLSSPYDVFIENKGIPFAIEGIIYFFKKTGEVLATRDLREMQPEATTADSITPQTPPQSQQDVLASSLRIEGGSKRLILIVKKDSWIEIRRTGAPALISRLVKAGVTETFDLTEVAQLIVGAPEGVEATLDGQVLMLPPIPNGTISRVYIK